MWGQDRVVLVPLLSFSRISTPAHPPTSFPPSLPTRSPAQTDQVSKIVDLESHVSTLETDLATTRTEAQALRSDYESQRAMLSQHQQALERMQQVF